jgi:hypothetical protein
VLKLPIYTTVLLATVAQMGEVVTSYPNMILQSVCCGAMLLCSRYLAFDFASTWMQQFFTNILYIANGL